jgi:hypothetical protein
LTHLHALTDDTGIIQHATADIPNRSTGYCTDDIARAFIVSILAAEQPGTRADAIRIGRTYLSFLLDAQREDGTFHNFMAYDRHWLDDVGSEDAIGRAAWALGFGASRAPLAGWRRVCRAALVPALPALEALRHPHACAYAILGLAHAVDADPAASHAFTHALRALADVLAAGYRATRSDDWEWFYEDMTYDSARLCEAMLRAGKTLGDATLVEVGRTTLAFYEKAVFESDRFAPIGNRGWYRRHGARARYDQQPLEAAATVDAELAALACDGDPARLSRARIAFSWYLGNNDAGATLVSDGGCRDGLAADSVNDNMGAESTLAYLASAFTLAEAEQARAAKNGGDDRRNRRSERRPA